MTAFRQVLKVVVNQILAYTESKQLEGEESLNLTFDDWSEVSDEKKFRVF